MEYIESPGVVWRKCGDLQPIGITQPAAGADFSYTLPGGGVYLFKSLNFQVASSATAGNRVVRVTFTHGGLLLCELSGSINHTASQTIRYSFFPGATREITLAQVTCQAAPVDFFLPGGTIIASSVANIQASDQISAIGLYVEFFPFAGEY